MIGLVSTIGVVVAAVAAAHLVISGRALLTAWSRWLVIGFTLLPFLAILVWLVGVPVPWQLAALAVLWLAFLWWRRFLVTKTVITRWGERARRKAGVASSLDVARTGSTAAIRRLASVVRPSLRDLPWWRRWTTTTTSSAVLLCRAGLWRVWASVEDVVLVLGAPRSGKSGWLAARIVDSPGACLVTSTRTDLLDTTGHVREGSGPVLVFNPTGLGGLTSTLTFDPVDGCQVPQVAMERATDLLAPVSGGGDDRQFWTAQAVRVLAALLHAAALGGRGMQDVLGWVSSPAGSEQEVITLLRRSSAAEAFVADARQFLTTNDRTQTSTTTTIMPALGWLTIQSAVDATAGWRSMSVPELLGARATVYLLAEQESVCAPLVSALTGHIARSARRAAAGCPGGRLDPPLRLCLDEAGLLAPPLGDWTADMGGRGVTIIAAFQSRSQLLTRWPENVVGTIFNNAAALMVFGGGKDKDDLGYWSHLAGERDEAVVTTDDRGVVRTRTSRKAPVVAPAQISNMPKFRVLLYRRGMPVVVGRARMFWQPTLAERVRRRFPSVARSASPAAAPAARSPETAT